MLERIERTFIGWTIYGNSTQHESTADRILLKCPCCDELYELTKAHLDIGVSLDCSEFVLAEDTGQTEVTPVHIQWDEDSDDGDSDDEPLI